jgi:hypothetical protein
VIGHVALLNGPTVFIRGGTATAQSWREDIVKGLVIYPPFKVRNELESIKSIDPPLVLTEVLSHTPARYFAKDPVAIPYICGAEALLKLLSAWGSVICRIVKTPNMCASA